MKFSDYLKQIGKTPHGYAVEHGLNIQTTWRAATGKHTPALSFVAFVEEESAGKVSVQDWLDSKAA